MPSSKLSWVEQGGFYGMTRAAQRELKLERNGTNFTAIPSDPQVRARFQFKGWDANSPTPEGYDQPISWLPMSMDNSLKSGLLRLRIEKARMVCVTGNRETGSLDLQLDLLDARVSTLC